MTYFALYSRNVSEVTVENSNFKILRRRTATVLKTEKLQYLMMTQNGSLSVLAVRRLGFLKF